MERAKAKSFPTASHTMSVSSAMLITTGTKMPLILSASFEMGRLGGRRLLHQADNLHQGGIFPHLLRLQHNGSGLVDAAGNQPGRPGFLSTGMLSPVMAA